MLARQYVHGATPCRTDLAVMNRTRDALRVALHLKQVELEKAAVDHPHQSLHQVILRLLKNQNQATRAKTAVSSLVLTAAEALRLTE